MAKKLTLVSPRMFCVLLVASLLLVPLGVFAGAAQFKSQKPRYVKVALTESGSKALLVAFDESKGTGTGCDVLYADADFSGTFEDAEKFSPKVEKCSTGIHCYFPVVKLNVPYDEKAKGVPNPCRVQLSYQRHSVAPPSATSTGRILRTTAPAPASPAIKEDFEVLVTIMLPGEDTTVWEYTFSGAAEPTETSKNPAIFSFKRTPDLTISTQPDGRNEGKFGIALGMVGFENRLLCESEGETVSLKATGVPRKLECKKEGSPIMAHVEIKTPKGKVVHKGDDSLDKFVFG